MTFVASGFLTFVSCVFSLVFVAFGFLAFCFTLLLGTLLQPLCRQRIRKKRTTTMFYKKVVFFSSLSLSFVAFVYSAPYQRKLGSNTSELRMTFTMMKGGARSILDGIDYDEGWCAIYTGWN